MATAKKRRTYISRIKNEIGGWIEEINLIKAKFCHDFASALRPIILLVLLSLPLVHCVRSLQSRT